MFRNVMFMFLGLALPTFIVGQEPEHTYCDMETAPNKNGDESWSGNCAVKAGGGPVSSSYPSMLGSWLKRVIQDILDNCDSGFKYHNGVRDDVVLCKTGRGGITTECSSPLMKVGGFPDKKRETNAIVAKRRHLTDARYTSDNPNQVLHRSEEPYAVFQYCSGRYLVQNKG
ncbi:hypothetical protein GQ44DRAFT_779953 [Phaeosphaeriaceae sp. PMI808]|nr:hypothetical protein GQ44DRAFT_779953 [Phaeosphaeriaceae sp. PMI808]